MKFKFYFHIKGQGHNERYDCEADGFNRYNALEKAQRKAEIYISNIVINESIHCLCEPIVIDLIDEQLLSKSKYDVMING